MDTTEEELLPLGEPTLHFPPPEKKQEPVMPMPQKNVPPVIPTHPGMPSAKQQSWGVIISIVIIVLMIITGAFYAWGQRIAQNAVFTDAPTQ